MIIFKSIKYKNFLSSGNSFTEIHLDKDKSTLVIALNLIKNVYVGKYDI